jgi:flagellar biosynthesis/type III secretory pathway protein FliH
MDIKDEERYKKIFEKLERNFADFLDDDKCLKLFGEGYKKGYNAGYQAAVEDMRMKMFQLSPEIRQKMSEDGAQPQWWPWW